MSNINKQAVQAVADLKAGYTLGHADVAILNELARIALASLEAEAVHQVLTGDAWVDLSKGAMDSQKRVGAIVRTVYTATPATVSVPDEMTPKQASRAYCGEVRGYRDGWNACRAAMLQGAEPVTKAYKLPFEQWLSQQTGTIDVECGCVMTEVFFHWLRVAYEAGNSPVIPDGWVVCSERMPEPEVDVQVYCSDKKEQMVGYLERNEREGCFRFATWRNGDGIYCQPTHWMPLPAAPQQEAKNV